jgi:hypothetical protein
VTTRLSIDRLRRAITEREHVRKSNAGAGGGDSGRRDARHATCPLDD